MRKCDEHQTLVTGMPSVCVCVCVGGGGTHIYINIYMKILKKIEIKRFWTPKNGHICVKISVSSPHPRQVC